MTAGCRSQTALAGHHADGDLEPVDRHVPHVVLRCPGPLVALRALAALYGVPAQDLAALLARETAGASTPEAPPGRLARAVSDAIGAEALTPSAVHYFHATWLHEPALVLKHGLPAAPTAPAGTGGGGRHRVADGRHADARGYLICDVLLRPSLYDTPDRLAMRAHARETGAARKPFPADRVAQRGMHAGTPCIVEYRRHSIRDDLDIDAGLRFVAAALRGGVSVGASLDGRQDTRREPVGAHDIVSVRAVRGQAEWTPHRQPQ